MEIKVGSKKITVSNPDKIFFPRDGYTKLDLVTYYAHIAPYMFPLIKKRAIMMHRFPQGINHEGFYHKNAPKHFAHWIKQINVPKEDGTTNFVVANNPAVMPYLANYGCVTAHTWLSTVDNLNKPDKMIFDLDPGKASFAQVQKAALLFKKALEALHLHPFVMTTGSHGMHIVVPIKRRYTFDYVKKYAHTIAQQLAEQYPTLLTLELRKNKRGKRIFIDYLRNEFGSTAVAPYAVRAHNGAPVATPIDWKEVSDKKLTSQRYTIANVFKRLAKQGDPWKRFAQQAKPLRKVKLS